MNVSQTIVMKKLVNETFSEEVLNNVLAVLEMKPTMAKTPAGFLSEAEACEFCGGIARSTLWHWRRQGLKSYTVGGRRLFCPDDLKAFVVQAGETADTVDTPDNPGR